MGNIGSDFTNNGVFTVEFKSGSVSSFIAAPSRESSKSSLKSIRWLE